MPVLIITGVVFNHVDKRPSIRQLYEIAELGKPKDEATHAPTFMKREIPVILLLPVSVAL